MKNKFSAVINCFNEELYIDVAISSIYQFMDEIVIVDNASTDKTIEIIKDFIDKKDLENKIKLYPLVEQLQLAEVRNFAIQKASNDWILKWDGDFCAYNDADECNKDYCSLSVLLEHVNKTADMFDFYLLYSINLAGDLYHIDSTRQYLGLAGDSFIGRKSCMRYLADDVYGDVGILRDQFGGPARIEYLNNPSKNPIYFVHIYAVKGFEYIFYRTHMSEYQVWKSKNLEIKYDFWDWITKIKGQDSKAGVNYIEREYLKVLIKHNKKLPNALKRYIDNPKFLIEYDANMLKTRKQYY